MLYQSSRGNSPEIGFDSVLLDGLARDGGLYLPKSWPQISSQELQKLKGAKYTDLASAIIKPYMKGSSVEHLIPNIVSESYKSFNHQAIAPLKQLSSNIWLMELFHGPTLAFKDYALQLVGQLFENVLSANNQHITIVGATSGDTGSAAIEACAGRKSMDIIILHPKGRVSEVQRRQMTTVMAENVHNIAVDGTFDDCQALVKAMFNNEPFRNELNLSAVNSINWVRIMGQIIYFAHAALSLGSRDQPITCSVPTGNFGNVFAGYCASMMGFPIHHFIVGSNKNDILTQYLETSIMKNRGVIETLSPAMDIQVSSNFERLLFEAYSKNGTTVQKLMKAFSDTGSFSVDKNAHAYIKALFSGVSLDDSGIKNVIKSTFHNTGMIIDPHTAIGIHAAGLLNKSQAETHVVMATAHPSKFPDAVESSIGKRPELPRSLKGLFSKKEIYTEMPNDLSKIKTLVKSVSRI
ncbi:MAG: threonine synthase [Rhodospirillaceae bacterium]|nr:threonine synthase [Rhodospirillaceae bacterium]